MRHYQKCFCDEKTLTFYVNCGIIESVFTWNYNKVFAGLKMVVGKTDVFERKYMAKFKEFASEYGEFVNYERDRCGRDIGIHFIQRLQNGEEKVTSSLVWFQLKGLMKETFTESDFENKDVKITIELKHLKYWYLQPINTYLVAYIESKDLFLILNTQRYIEEVFGKAILSDESKTKTIIFNKDSILDDHALKLIIRKGEMSEWQRGLNMEPEIARICIKNYNLIWHLRKSFEEDRLFKVEFKDWQSKSRSELYIKEMVNNDWHYLRVELEYMSSLEDFEKNYPFLDFISNINDDYLDWDEEDNVKYEFESGIEIEGIDASGEYYFYEFEVKLNDFGKELLEKIKVLNEIGLIEIKKEIETEIISIAPWNKRDI